MAEKVCPIWVGYILVSPLRKLWQNPAKILKPYVKEGMTVLDIGCAMGFFSIPLARMVGTNGKIICVDVQDKMIEVLKKRAIKAGVFDRIETRVCDRNSLCLEDFIKKIEFACAIAVVHEVPDVSAFFSDIYKALKSDGKLLVVEPKGHVKKEEFEKTVYIAEQNNYEVIDRPKAGRSHAVLLKKISEKTAY